jgi:hypothetical protein
MADLLTKPRQLAPTVGQNASGARIQAGSTFAGIGGTVAIGRVLYDPGFPIIPADNLWVPARENPARFIVVPIKDIHIFIGETNSTPATENDFRRIGMAETPYGPLLSWIRRTNHLIWNFSSHPDQIQKQIPPNPP